jgi:hypothetical protein
MNGSGQPPNALLELAQTVSPPEAGFHIQCTSHPEKDAFICCPSCGRGLCPECMMSDPLNSRLLCPECKKSASAEKISFIRVLKAFKYPGLWVLLFIVSAVILYLNGCGNPDIGMMMREDAKMKWYLQRAGMVYLEQACREKQRAAVLESKKRGKEAAKWSIWSAKAFGESYDIWSKTPAANHLLIAKAEALAHGGQAPEALKILGPMNISPDDKLYGAWQFRLGNVYDLLSEKEKAQAAYANAADSLSKRQMKSFDDMIDQYSSDRNDSGAVEKISALCGTDVTYQMAEAKYRPSRPVEKVENHAEDGEEGGSYSEETEPGNAEVQAPPPKKDSDFEVEFLEPGERKSDQ